MTYRLNNSMVQGCRHLISSEPISPLSSLKEPFSLKKESALSKEWLEHFFSSLWIQALRMKAWSYLRVCFPLHEKNLTWAEAKWQHTEDAEKRNERFRWYQSVLSPATYPAISTIYVKETWRVIKTVKTDSIQVHCKRGKKPQYRVSLVLKTTWKGGNL